MPGPAFQLPVSAERYLEYLQSRQRKDSTLKRYRYDLADFFRYIEVAADDKPIKKITTKNVEGYFSLLHESRDYQARTLKRIHTVLCRYFHYLYENSLIEIDPMKNFSFDEAIWTEIKQSDLVEENEEKRLINSLLSDLGMSVKQAAARPMLAPRNLVILSMLSHYGLRLHELAALRMKNINQGTGKISIPEETGNPREFHLLSKDKARLHHYLKVIPQAVRPQKATDPLFVAFDFQRQTYRWSYGLDAPKYLTEIAIQKMIREERKRAGIMRAISARHFRHTYIIRELRKGTAPDRLQRLLGLQSPLTLLPYQRFVEKEKLIKSSRRG
ncbi:tyrosine-type recombinase/integrase [Alteribacillus sp. HJP-4]|uniref:tyrosine-type recombinase/integrase n=1 Tax=Alteribacillus sp. HJP-4 TaxID=2775394 RepID=UPI0035CD14C0